MANYINNKDLFKEIMISKEQGQLTPTAVKMLQLLVKKSITVLRYKDIEDKEDCMAGGMEDLLRYWDRFNPEKSTNAFAYFTQICKRGITKSFKKITHPTKSTTDMISLSNIKGFYNV